MQRVVREEAVAYAKRITNDKCSTINTMGLDYIS